MILKTIHIVFVILTFISFSIRGFWMITESPLLHRKVTKILPHVIDTALFISGVAMAIMLYGAFYKQGWLMIKLLALCLYIILGSIALKYGKTKNIRSATLIAAWCVFFYIIAVARYHDVIPI